MCHHRIFDYSAWMVRLLAPGASSRGVIIIIPKIETAWDLNSAKSRVDDRAFPESTAVSPNQGISVWCSSYCILVSMTP